MIIKKAEFMRGVVLGQEVWENDVPQIVFYGRSNAGKSSAINALLGRKSLAKSSATPGKTKEINFFNINDEFLFVDLPGYGYARVSKEARKKLQKLIMWFALDTHVNDRINVFIVDAKVGITDLDKEILDLMYEKEEDIIVLLNKTDKLNQKERLKSLTNAKKELPRHVTVLPFSAKKGSGVKEFWGVVEGE